MKRLSRRWITAIGFWLVLAFLSGAVFGGWYDARSERNSLLSSTDVEQAMQQEGLTLVKTANVSMLTLAGVDGIIYTIGSSRELVLTLFVCASEDQQRAVRNEWAVYSKSGTDYTINKYSVNNIFILLNVSLLESGVEDKMERAIVRLAKP